MLVLIETAFAKNFVQIAIPAKGGSWKVEKFCVRTSPRYPDKPKHGFSESIFKKESNVGWGFGEEGGKIEEDIDQIIDNVPTATLLKWQLVVR